MFSATVTDMIYDQINDVIGILKTIDLKDLKEIMIRTNENKDIMIKTIGTIKNVDILKILKINNLKSLYQNDKLIYAQVAYDNYIWAIYQLSSNLCKIFYKSKKKELLKLAIEMGFDQYRKIYPLELQHGIQKLKYILVKYHLEGILLLFGPVFLRIVRGE